MKLTEQERKTLLDVAIAALKHGLVWHVALPVDPRAHSAALQEEKATFVTLKQQGRLRGCVGTVEPFRPLVVDVAHSAFAAAFRDTRFPQLRAKELADLDVYISILSIPEEIQFDSELELLQRIRPGEDGLILEDGYNRGVFLPVMWAHLTTPNRFLEHLKVKAGLPEHHWSDTVKVHRFANEDYISSTGEPDTD